MRRLSLVPAVALSLSLALAAGPGAAEASPAQGQSAVARGKGPAPEQARVLVFSRTRTFRHYSIPLGISMVRELGAANGFGVEATEDETAFRGPNLRRFSAVVFINTTGNVLDERGQRALKRFVKRRRGGYVGIHPAADTEHGWPWYRKLVGASFLSHPLQQPASFDNEAPNHLMTRHLDQRFSVVDEFYSFVNNPRENVRVLLSIDEDSYLPDPNTSHLPGGTPTTGYMGDHPMAWCHSRFGGRVFYTALGHEDYLYALDWFRTHVLGGIRYAIREARADCRPR